MPLIFRLASRNLLQDRLRFVATVVGVVFSIVLVTVQMGLFLSFERMVTTMIDHAPADLWVVPLGTKCFEDPTLLDEHDRTRALSVAGVTAAVPLLIGFTQWAVPTGGTTPVLVIGSNGDTQGLQPWNVIKGNTGDLAEPHAVAIDRTYFDRLGMAQVGDTTEIRDQPVHAVAITSGIRSFTTTPYVFTSLSQARSYIGTPPNRVSYFLIHVGKGTDIASVRKALLANIPKIEVLTPDEFRSRSRSFWLFGTGAGAALFAGALLGIIVGMVVVAQTLYSSTKDHLSEFATLRAIGSSGWYIHKVIICQALLSAVIGFAVAASVSLAIVRLTVDTALPIMMTPLLTSGLLLLTVLMCVVSAIAAIVQVLRVDPVVVFR
ncbi:MAG TPA: ABC transporter permease [Acetobacteraceae bacterium]|jgi:putative ABC transport system permease protein|nr:ABC transporter permease [Acetobacteraceae bacterium]